MLRRAVLDFYGNLTTFEILNKLKFQFTQCFLHFESDDLLINSLGLLAFVSRKVDPMFPLIELDLLADWIYEQLNENGQTPSALVCILNLVLK